MAAEMQLVEWRCPNQLLAQFERVASRIDAGKLAQFERVASRIDAGKQAGPALRDEVLNAALLSFVNLPDLEQRTWVKQLRNLIPIWANPTSEPTAAPAPA